MNRYRIKATVKKTYVAEEEVTFDVDAEDEDQARASGRRHADEHADIGHFDADHEDTDIYINEIAFLAGENEDGTVTAIRCDKTPDMFQGGT